MSNYLVVEEISKGNLELAKFCDVLKIFQRLNRPYTELLVFGAVVARIIRHGSTTFLPIPIWEIEEETQLSEITVLKSLKSLAKSGDLIVDSHRGRTTRFALPVVSFELESKSSLVPIEPLENHVVAKSPDDEIQLAYRNWQKKMKEQDAKQLFSLGIRTQLDMEEYFTCVVWPDLQAANQQSSLLSSMENMEVLIKEKVCP